MSTSSLRLGLVGYGVGGRYFHAPFIAASGSVEIVGIVTRSPERVAHAEADLPEVPVYSSLAALLDSGVDVVTITTPPLTRRELVLEAVARGVHVIADKPFAPNLEGGRELVRAAEEAGVMLSVFHNRRWDADLRTLAGVIHSGELGELWRVHSRFDLDDPGTMETGAGGGMLRDLGSHVVDQMLWLLGPATHVSAVIDETDRFGARVDCGFSITLRHSNGVHSTVESSKLNHASAREFRAYGSAGSYLATGTDVQAQAIFAGRRPIDDPTGWGHDDERLWGVLATDAGMSSIPSAQGDYAEFYRQFAAAVAGIGPQPVSGAEALGVLAVLDAARASASSDSTIVLPA